MWWSIPCKWLVRSNAIGWASLRNTPTTQGELAERLQRECVNLESTIWREGFSVSRHVAGYPVIQAELTADRKLPR